MRHEPTDGFHGTPRGRPKSENEDQLRARLYAELRPLEQAREDSNRVHDDAHGLAGNFADRTRIVRARELGLVRSQAVGAVDEEIDEAGPLLPAVALADVAQTTERAALRAERAQVEQRKNALNAIEARQLATAAYEAWRHESGAKLRHTPWPSMLMTLFIIACAGFVELCAMAAILAGPPIEGVPTGFVLGLLFASASVMVGVLGGVGASLAADLRRKRRLFGWVAIGTALLVWAVSAVAGAHLRAVIEAGGGGSGAEILASMSRGLFSPFVSPLALFLIGASALATMVALLKWRDHIGTPLGHREKDLERLYAEAELHRVEECHRAEVLGVIGEGFVNLEEIEKKAWQPANSGHRLERELAVIVAHARECAVAIDRIVKAIAADYTAATRRLRSGVDVTADMELPPIEAEGLGDTQDTRARLAQLTQGAAGVADAVGDGKAALHQLEVEHLLAIDRLYGLARPAHFGPGSAGVGAHQVLQSRRR